MKYTIKQFHRDFPNDAACLERIMEVRHGGTKLTCPGCGTVDAQFHPMTKRRAYACQECGAHLYPCAGSIFHKSRTKLTDWFLAMYLLTNTRHGVSAKELQRQTGTTYKCSWRMLHELRKLMIGADFGGMLGGADKPVEIDETFVGGRTRVKGRNKFSNKSVVMGMTERDGGKLRAGVIENTYGPTMQRVVFDNIKANSPISTDEHRSYIGLGKHYKHGVVNHAADEYVRGDDHVNSLEGHWSLLKRSIKGTHTSVSAKHLWKYVGEFSYRRNFRHSPSQMFDRLVAAFGLPRLVET